MRLCDEALELARRSGDDRTLAVVLWRRFNAITLPDTLDERIAEMEELKTIAERLNDPVLRFWAAVYGSTPAMETGNRDAFNARVAALNEIAEELKQPVPNWLANWLAAVREMVSGRLGEAERFADEAAQNGSDAGQADAITFYVGQLHQIRWAQGRLDEVVDPLAMTSEENPDLSSAHALLAFTHCELGQTDRARSLLEPVAADRFEAVPRDMLWLNTMVAWAEVAAAVEHAEAAAVLYEMLKPWPDQFPSISIVIWMPVSHYLGRLAALLGRSEDAERHFERALELEERFEAPLFAAATRIAWGRLLLGGGSEDAARAHELLEQARSSAKALDAAGIEQHAAALLEGAGTSGDELTQPAVGASLSTHAGAAGNGTGSEGSGPASRAASRVAWTSSPALWKRSSGRVAIALATTASKPAGASLAAVTLGGGAAQMGDQLVDVALARVWDARP